MTATAPHWLKGAYICALAVHALVLLGVLFLAGAGVFGPVRADSAPDTLFFLLVLQLPVLVLGVPALVALLSWHFCRRLSVPPSAGHMGLAVAAATGYVAVLAAGAMR